MTGGRGGHGHQDPGPRIESPAGIRQILVVKLAGIGDLLTAFPALEALRGRWPEAEITALVTPQTESLLQGAGLVDRVMVLDKYLFDDAGGFLRPRRLAALLRLAADLRSRSFDVAILLHHLVTWAGVAKYALLMMATGARWRVGLNDGRGRFLNLSARDGGFGALHEVDYWLVAVRLLGATTDEPRVRGDWGREEEEFARQVWSRLRLDSTDSVVAVHPGSGSYSTVRRWYPERYAAVASALAADGLIPLVVAGPGEEELARMVAAGAGGGGRELEGVPSARKLAAVLAGCRLFVGNDGGVMHLAFAAGVPVVAVFGPSNHRAWGPYDPGGERSRIVRVDLPCSPCFYRGQSLGLRYGCGDLQCLLRIVPEGVIAAARELLAATAPAQSARRPRA